MRDFKCDRCCDKCCHKRCGKKCCSRGKKRQNDTHKCKEPTQETLCGRWSNLSPMLLARHQFGAASGPDKDATGTAQGVDNDPRVYVVGGLDDNEMPTDQCEKYNPNTNTWSPIASLPEPLGQNSAVFVPDYAGSLAQGLGYIYTLGGDLPILFRYDIKDDQWDTFPIPFSRISSTLAYLDDFGGPLAQLFISTTGVDLPACTDTETIWSIGGVGTEQEVWYAEINISGEIVGNWTRGPDLPLLRKKPLIGRTFWRDAGITSYGVSNCATIIVSGGLDNEGVVQSDVQILVRDSTCNWAWIYPGDSTNSTTIPDKLLTLAQPVSEGAFGTEQWPETLVTGGRPILFGGVPGNNNGGSTQFAQVRFSNDRKRYCRDTCLLKGPNPNSAWNTTTDMPGQRTEFVSAPLSQENSSVFGGRRISRFICMGGVENGSGTVLDRVQLFQLPVPAPFLLARENTLRCTDTKSSCNSCNSCK